MTDTGYDENGFELPLPVEQCANRASSPKKCSGPVHTRYSRSGLTTTIRCEGHETAHQDMLDSIADRYPDSDTPPSWFDPTYAGESWNGD